MASKEQRDESRAISDEFITLNKELGLLGKCKGFLNSHERRLLIRVGIKGVDPKKCLSLEKAREAVAAKRKLEEEKNATDRVSNNTGTYSSVPNGESKGITDTATDLALSVD